MSSTLFFFLNYFNSKSIPIAVGSSHVGLSFVDERERLDEERNIVDRHCTLGLRPGVEADGVEGQLEFRACADGHRAVTLGLVVPLEHAGPTLSVLNQCNVNEKIWW